MPLESKFQSKTNHNINIYDNENTSNKESMNHDPTTSIHPTGDTTAQWMKSIPPPPAISPPPPPAPSSLHNTAMNNQVAHYGMSQQFNPTNPFGTVSPTALPSMPSVLPPRNPAPTIAALPAEANGVTKKKKNKKRKAKKQSKNKTNESNTPTVDVATAASYAATYRQQYNTMQQSNDDAPSIINYHDGGEEDVFCNDSILSRLFRTKRKKYSPISTNTTIYYGDKDEKNHPSTDTKQQQYSHGVKKSISSSTIPTSTPSITTSSFFPNTPTNTGVLNSSHGEGTTIPQLLIRMRILNIVHVILTLSLEGWAILGSVVTLNFAGVILGVYFVFFVILLGIFELLRGRPILTTTVSEDDQQDSANLNGGINSFTNLPTQQAQLMGSVLWKMVVDGEQFRSVRRFMQDNFGILYSCKGRGIYICFVGGIALGQGWLLSILGCSFICLGVWTISLGIRYPALDKAFVSNLDMEEEFWRTAGGGDTAFSYETNSVNGGISAGAEDDKSTSNVTWSSVGLSYSTGARSLDSSVYLNEKRTLLS